MEVLASAESMDDTMMVATEDDMASDMNSDVASVMNALQDEALRGKLRRLSERELFPAPKLPANEILPRSVTVSLKDNEVVREMFLALCPFLPGRKQGSRPKRACPNERQKKIREEMLLFYYNEICSIIHSSIDLPYTLQQVPPEFASMFQLRCLDPTKDIDRIILAHSEAYRLLSRYTFPNAFFSDDFDVFDDMSVLSNISDNLDLKPSATATTQHQDDTVLGEVVKALGERVDRLSMRIEEHCAEEAEEAHRHNPHKKTKGEAGDRHTSVDRTPGVVIPLEMRGNATAVAETINMASITEADVLAILERANEPLTWKDIKRAWGEQVGPDCAVKESRAYNKVLSKLLAEGRIQKQSSLDTSDIPLFCIGER